MIAAWWLACEQDMVGHFSGPIRARVLVDGVRTDVAADGPVELARDGDRYTLSVLGCELDGHRNGAVLQFGPQACTVAPPGRAPVRVDGVTAHVQSVTVQHALGLWTEVVRVQVIVDDERPFPALRIEAEATP